MAQPEIYSNPDRLSALADDLRIFNNDLRTELGRIDDGLHRLGATWQDEEYKRFMGAIDKLKGKLIELDQEIGAREPELKEDARLLRDYLGKSMP